MAQERLSDLGYLAVSKETVKGTPATVPSIYVPIYSESVKLSVNNGVDKPVVGQNYESYQILPGMRSVGGSVEVMGEPNTLGYFLDMLLVKSSTSGAGPYTHSFGLSKTAFPNSYTVDIAKGNIVHRFMGMEAEELKPSWAANEMHVNMKLSGLRSFISRGIATISTVTVTLDTLFSKRPTDGLLAGDLINITKADGSATTAFTIAAGGVNADGITLTLTASAAAFAAGDKVTIRPATPSLTLLTPFLWSNTQFCFGTTASAALSAAQTPLEEGSEFTLNWSFKDGNGEHRSGSQDAATLVRVRANTAVTLKKFFDLPLDQENFQNLTGQALVVRHYSGASNQYEFRMTFNDLRFMDTPTPEVKAGEILYSSIPATPVYKGADGQAFDAKVINNVATV